MRFRIFPPMPAAARGFRRNVSGATVVVFALCLIPAIGLIGLGVDYMQGLSYKRRLDAAADSASLAAIAGAQAYYTANQATLTEPALSNGAVAAGQAQGSRAFAANAGSTVGALGVSAKVVVTPPTRVDSATGQANGPGQFSATTQYAGAMPTHFGKLFGTGTLGLSASSSSSVTMGSYLDFYLALDVSGSMGLPTSATDQAILAQNNSDNWNFFFNYPNGCVFACHFKYYKGYDIARQYNLKLRVDSVATAVSKLIARAQTTATMPNQFRIGLYPFIDNVMEAAAISNDFTAAQAVADALGGTYLDTGYSNPATQAMGSGGTHFENVLPPFQNYIKRIGDGSTSLKPKPFLFIITDGVDNNQTYDGMNWSWGGSEPQEPTNINLQTCQNIRQSGVTISILYIPYLPIQPQMSYEDTQTDNIIGSLHNDLSQCASNGFMFQANTDEDITKAVQVMFTQALQMARLTH